MNFKVAKLVVYLLSTFSLTSPILGLKNGDPCVTPNGEKAKCQSISECKVIRDALITKDPNSETVAFALRSHEDCGFDDQVPMVCCGGYARIVVGETCTTPNGESTTCVIPSTCTIIMDALKSGNAKAMGFVKNSLCGNKNVSLVCCGSEAYMLETNLLPNRTVCDQQKSDNRIFGGTATQLSEFPWMALLIYVDSNGENPGLQCGGSLINERYVLTAAHCVRIRTGVSVDKVRLGEWRISTEIDCEEDVPIPKCADPVIEVKVEEQIIHSEFERKYGRNDIALLRLEKNVIYTEYVRPICLPVAESPEPVPGSEMYVAGWGETENASNSDYKRKATVPIVSREFCAEKVTRRGGPVEGHVCTGIGSNDSCYGDSGGPLMQKVKKNFYALPRWFQEGIISWGVGCALQDSPAIYTRVPKYMNWIIENLKPF